MAWLLLFISIGLIATYQFKEKTIFLMGGLALLAISSVSLLDKYLFPDISLISFIYFWALGIFGIIIYYKKRLNLFLILGTVLFSLGIHNLIQELVNVNISWFRFILVSLAFYISYYIDYRKNNIIWPKYLSILFLIIGAIVSLYYKGLFHIGIWSFLSYLIPIFVIIIGIGFFYLTLNERI